jgi:hypothetical protein
MEEQHAIDSNVFQSEYTRVFKEHNTVHLQISDFPENEEFQQAWKFALKLAAEQDNYHWVMNMKDLRMLRPKSIEWLQQQWLKEALQLPKRARLAMILPDTASGQLTVRRALYKINDRHSGFFTAFRSFYHTGSAIKWLKEGATL